MQRWRADDMRRYPLADDDVLGVIGRAFDLYQFTDAALLNTDMPYYYEMSASAAMHR
jgi:hypothetical protein